MRTLTKPIRGWIRLRKKSSRMMTSLKSNFPCEIFKQFSLFEKEAE